MFKLGKENIDKVYLGKSPVQKMYLGKTLVFPNEEAAECYAITPSIAQYDGDYPWVWAEDTEKWYRLNNHDEYEEYGIYGDSIEPDIIETTDYYNCAFNGGSYYEVVQSQTTGVNYYMKVEFTTPESITEQSFLFGTRLFFIDAFAAGLFPEGDTGIVLKAHFGPTTVPITVGELQPSTKYVGEFQIVKTSTTARTATYTIYDEMGEVVYSGNKTGVSFNGTAFNMAIGTLRTGATLPATVYLPYSGEMSRFTIKKSSTATADNYNWDDVCDVVFTDENGTIVPVNLYSTDVTITSGAGNTATLTDKAGQIKNIIERGESTYKGKLSIVDGIEYEWNGSKWVEVPSITYDVCTAMFDGQSAFDTEATMGYPREYSYIFKPASDGVSTNGIGGVNKGNNMQMLYLENYRGGGLHYVFGSGNEYNSFDVSKTVNNAWTKFDISVKYRSSSYRQFAGSYNTADTFNPEGWTLLQTLTDTTDKTANETLTAFVGDANSNGNPWSPMIGEFHSVSIRDAANTTSTSPTWRPYRDLIFVNVDGEIKMYDKVTEKFFSNIGTGTVTQGTVYDSITLYKKYDERPAPEKILYFDSIEEMEAYECVYDKAMAMVGDVLYVYVDNRWEPRTFDNSIKYTTTDNKPLSKTIAGSIANIMINGVGYYYFNVAPTTIPNDAFYNVTTLNTVILPDGIKTIGNQAFRGCTSLTDVYIPEGATSIGGYGFQGCTKLASITLPDSLTNIGEFAFNHCEAIKTITIPSGVTVINRDVLQDCKALTTVIFEGNVTSIGNEAFRTDTALTSITIPDSVTSIGIQAFYSCSGLTSIEIPDSVTGIGNEAFNACSSLTSVTIGSGLKTLGGSMFGSCSKLASINIPDTVTTIGQQAFIKCTSLATVTIGSGVTSIGGGAFSECKALSAITITAPTRPELGTGVFLQPKEYGTLTYPEGSDYNSWLSNSYGYLGYYNWNAPEAECYPASCSKYLVTNGSNKQYYSVLQGETAITDCNYNLTGLKTWTGRNGDFTSFGGTDPAFNAGPATSQHNTIYDTLKEIDITLPDTLTTFTAAFGQKVTSLKKLKRITFRNFGVVTKMYGTGGDNFNIPCLEYLSVDTYNTSTFTSSGGLVHSSATALTDFYVDRITDSGNRSFTAPNLTYDSLMRIINALDSTTNGRTLTLGATNLAKLTEEEIAIATDKGWIVQ